jgi:hypothetical protein
MAKASYVWSGSAWVQVASAIPQTNQRGVNNINATSHTLNADDTGKALIFNNNSAVTLTVPKDSTYSFAIGQTFVLIQHGTGAVTVQAESGTTLRSMSSYVKTSGQYAEARLIKIDTDEWVLSGDLSS